MFTSRFFTFSLALGTVAVSAPPAPVERRAGLSDVLSVVSALQGSTSSILPQIDSLVSGVLHLRRPLLPSSASSSQLLVQPLRLSLTSALLDPPLEVQARFEMPSDPSSPAPQQITTTLSGATIAVPGLSSLLPVLSLDIALEEVLVTVEFLVAGVLAVVTSLLGDITGLLNGLALSLVLELLEL